MGVVHLARTEGARGFSRPVVVKSLRPDLLARSDMADMFVQEARILSNLSHPGIVKVLDFGEDAGRYVMVLEYVSGYELGRWRRYLLKSGQQMPTSFAVHIMSQVLDALHYAHNLKRDDGQKLEIVHRDVSPSNILLSEDGQVRLLDFGIARMTAGGAERRKESFQGKLLYSAPEVLSGDSASPLSDVYSVAVVLYQLLAGKNPFGTAESNIIEHVLTHVPAPLRARRTDVSMLLDDLLATALEKKPERRFRTAAEFAKELRGTLATPSDLIQQELAATVYRDFYGRLPEVMNVARLEARDQAWRASVPAPRKPSEGHASSDPATVLERASEGELILPVRTTRERTRRRKRLEFWGRALALLGILCAGVIVAPNLLPSIEPTRMTVSGATNPYPSASLAAVARSSAEANLPPSGAVLEAANHAQTSSSEPKLDPPSRNTPSPSQPKAPTANPNKALVVRLTQTVEESSQRFVTCYDRSPPETGVDQFSVKFNINKKGKPTAVSISPRAVGKSAFGQCVAQQLFGLQFPVQTRKREFRIPISLREVLQFHGR